MIVYIASYPRCGNSLIRSIIHTYFRYPTTSIYPRTPAYPENFPYAANWRLGMEITITNRKRFWMVWNEWIALFDSTVEAYKRDIRFLLRGCKPALTPGNRRRLAAEDTVFFVKTHQMPFESYFEGEHVIQPVRHPGPVFRSYFNLWTGKPDSEEVSLEGFIRGEIPVGSWSDYHRAWTTALETMPGKSLRLRFEEVVDNQPSACPAISELTGLRYFEDSEPIDIDDRSSRNPNMFGFGTNQNWESYYTRDQLVLLWDRHQEMMQYFRYDEPDYSAAKPS
jgi:hypothetical protein